MDRMLLVARRSAVIPGALGLGTTATWLLTGGRMIDVGPFYLFGMLAVGLGVVMLPLGLAAVAIALRRGASRAAVVPALAMLLANVPLAGACWKTADSLLDLQIIRVVNASEEVVGPVTLRIEPTLKSDHVLEIDALGPGESRKWVLHYAGEGTATFRAKCGDRWVESSSEERVFLGIGQPMRVLVKLADGGGYEITGEFNPRWSWIDALWP